MIELKENFDPQGISLRSWNIYGSGKFGDIYEINLKQMEELFLVLGDYQ